MEINNNDNLFFEYSYFGRHVGMIYAFLALFVFAPMPFYGNYIFGHEIKTNAIAFFGIVGLAAAIIYVWTDIKNQHLFCKVMVTSTSIESIWDSNVVSFEWNEIKMLENLKYGDRMSMIALGLQGLRIISKDQKEILIFGTIQKYQELISILKNNTGLELV